MNDIQRKLLDQNRISLADEVNRDMFFYVREAIGIKIAEGGPKLTVHISSNGGAVGWGLDIYDLLAFYTGQKVAIVHSMAASMASIILQACEWRISTQFSSVLIHHINSQSLKLDTARDEDELKKFVEGMERSQTKLYGILVGRTGKTLEEIRAKCKEEVPMSAQEAKEYGLIDQVIVRESDIKIPEPSA